MTLQIDEEDPLLGSLRALPTRDVPSPRAEDIRRRCERELARRTRAQSRPAESRPHWRLVLEPTVVAGLSAMFLIEIARRAATLY